MMLMMLVFLTLLPALVKAVAIDNKLMGAPEVQCGPSGVQFSFSTEKNYEGIVYAKNHYLEPQCGSRAAGGVKGGGITLGFDQCNAKRFRSLDPRGIFVTLTLVVQFHKDVITKIDRAYHIRCFYMEADKTVDAQLEVSMITTDLVTLTVPMPVCRYEILSDDTQRQPVRFAIIGQKIIHKWTCDTETQNTFCMEVYSCYVDDTLGGTKLPLIDESGCSLDGNLVPNPNYPTDLMAEAGAHVFSWADRPALYFNCQIRIGIKEPNSECEAWRVSQGPAGKCPVEPLTLGRKKRSIPFPFPSVSSPGVQEVDVAPAFPLFVADMELNQWDVPSSLFRPQSLPSNDFCVSGTIVWVLVLLIVLLLITAVAMTAVLCVRKGRKEH